MLLKKGSKDYISKDIPTNIRSWFSHNLPQFQRFYPVKLCNGRTSDELYVMVYRTEWARFWARCRGEDKRIAARVYALCREKDDSDYFAHYVPKYSVTSLERLKQTGALMGMMRDNPTQF